MIIKGVIFDMDGVMFDTEKISTFGWSYLDQTYALNMPKNLIDSMRGLNGNACRDIFNQSITGSMTFEQADGIASAYMDGYIHAKGVPVKKGLVSLLKHLKKKIIKLQWQHQIQNNAHFLI